MLLVRMRSQISTVLQTLSSETGKQLMDDKDLRPLQLSLRPIYTPSTHYLHIICTLSIQSTHYLQPNYNVSTHYLLAGAGDNNYSLACPPVRWQLSSHTTATDNILDSKVILPRVFRPEKHSPFDLEYGIYC